ncbi:MAG TPA: 4'-phosphopantetheinyl transferase superfamily protein [Methyloversatilis sp.]
MNPNARFSVMPIAGDEVHLWLAVRPGMPGGDDGSAQLSPAETARARRFVHDADRARFVFAHVVLRDVLGRYLGMAPADVGLDVDQRGKPRLAQRHGSDLRFNLSHSGDAVLCGIASGREIGVDVEAAIAREDLSRIAAHFFATDECAALDRCTKEAHTMRFHEIWTRKEAYVKALGAGLAQPLQSFSVMGDGHEESPVRDAGVSTVWHVRSVPVPDGYAAAVVVEGAGARLACRRWPGVAPAP